LGAELRKIHGAVDKTKANFKFENQAMKTSPKFAIREKRTDRSTRRGVLTCQAKQAKSIKR
jgi:hypothetical protein